MYSLRAREHPTVSTPVKWEEVEHMLKKKDASLLVFEAGEVLKRVEKMGDLFEPALTLKQKLPKSAEDVGAGDPARCGERKLAGHRSLRPNWKSQPKPDNAGNRQDAENQETDVALILVALGFSGCLAGMLPATAGGTPALLSSGRKI